MCLGDEEVIFGKAWEKKRGKLKAVTSGIVSLSIIRWIDTSTSVLKCALKDYHREYQDIAELKLNLQYLAGMQEVQDLARMKEEEYNRAQEPHKSYVDNDGFYTFDRPVAKELV